MHEKSCCFLHMFLSVAGECPTGQGSSPNSQSGNTSENEGQINPKLKIRFQIRRWTMIVVVMPIDFGF